MLVCDRIFFLFYINVYQRRVVHLQVIRTGSVVSIVQWTVKDSA